MNVIHGTLKTCLGNLLMAFQTFQARDEQTVLQKLAGCMFSDTPSGLPCDRASPIKNLLALFVRVEQNVFTGSPASALKTQIVGILHDFWHKSLQARFLL